MTLPSPVTFSSLHPGDVFLFGGTSFLMKSDAINAVRLGDGSVAPMPTPDSPCLFLPAAKLDLG